MKVTNMKFTEDEKFRTGCEAAGVNPTKRQASKFRRGIGAAFNITFHGCKVSSSNEIS